MSILSSQIFISFLRSYQFSNAQYPWWNYLGACPHEQASNPRQTDWIPDFYLCGIWFLSEVVQEGKMFLIWDLGSVSLVHSQASCGDPGATMVSKVNSWKDE